METQRINADLSNVKTFEDYKLAIDRVWGWYSDNTLYLLEGFYRLDERAKDKIITVK